MEVHRREVLVQGRSGQVLGEHVGGVPRPQDLEDAKVPPPNAFLDPELAHR